MTYDRLSGSSINVSKKLLFDQFDNEKCFLGFSRSDTTWGTCSLISITPINNITYFKDKIGYPDPANRIVHIYKTKAGVETYVEFGVDIYLEYINTDWCVLRNLPAGYSTIMTLATDTEYHIKNLEWTSSVKINLREEPKNILVEPVSLNITDSQMTTNDTCISGLYRTITPYGEIEYVGLTDGSFLGDSTESSLIRKSKIVHNYFIFVNSYEVGVTEKLQLQTNYNSGAESIFFYDSKYGKYLLLKGTTSYVKLSYNPTYTELAIYNENLPYSFPIGTFANNVSDASPPALSTGYLHSSAIDTSIFEVQSYINIKRDHNYNKATKAPVVPTTSATCIKYVKEIAFGDISSWTAKGFVDGGTKRIESLLVETSGSTTRFSNLRPKPNGTVYNANDKTLYLWANVFVVGDMLTIDKVSGYHVIAIDSNSSSIVIDSGLPTSLNSTKRNTIYSNLAQITCTSTVEIKAYYAVCDVVSDALKYGMESVMVDIYIPSSETNLYNGVYRQLFVCCNPSYYINSIKTPCTSAATYIINSGNITTYSNTPSSYDIGTLLYLSNKIPVYRKYIKSSTPEHFTIVI